MGADSIKVTLRMVRNVGPVKAIAHVTVPTLFGSITLRWFRVVELDTATVWVGFPSITYLRDGRPVNRAVVILPVPFRQQVQNAILEKLAEVRQEEGLPEVLNGSDLGKGAYGSQVISGRGENSISTLPEPPERAVKGCGGRAPTLT